MGNKVHKAKKEFLDTICTMTEHDVWRWETEHFRFKWTNSLGINLYMWPKEEREEHWHPILFVRSLHDGVAYTQGIQCGYEVYAALEKRRAARAESAARREEMKGQDA